MTYGASVDMTLPCSVKKCPSSVDWAGDTCHSRLHYWTIFSFADHIPRRVDGTFTAIRVPRFTQGNAVQKRDATLPGEDLDLSTGEYGGHHVRPLTIAFCRSERIDLITSEKFAAALRSENSPNLRRAVDYLRASSPVRRSPTRCDSASIRMVEEQSVDMSENRNATTKSKEHTVRRPVGQWRFSAKRFRGARTFDVLY